MTARRANREDVESGLVRVGERPVTGGDEAAGTVRPYHGWFVVAAVCWVLAVGGGLSVYSLSVYLPALVDERDFSVGQVSGATTMFFVAVGIGGVVVARLLARLEARLVMCAGAAIGGLALLLLGRVEHAWQLFAVYALFGLGFASVGMLPGTTVITRWFDKRRGTAMTVATSGLSIGGVLVTPAVAWLIDRRSLAQVAPWLGAAFLVAIAPVAWAFIANGRWAGDPASDGSGRPPALARGGQAGVQQDADSALHSPYFRDVTLYHGLAMLAQVGAVAHLFNLVTERSSSVLAGTAVSVMALASLIARFVGGVALARIGLRPFTYGLLVLQCAALLLLAAASGPVALLAGSALLGSTVGNLLMAHPLLLAAAFGVRDYARLYSRSFLYATVGIASGPVLLGLARDWSGGYFLPLAVAAAASLLAVAALRLSAERMPAPASAADGAAA